MKDIGLISDMQDILNELFGDSDDKQDGLFTKYEETVVIKHEDIKNFPTNPVSEH